LAFFEDREAADSLFVAGEFFSNLVTKLQIEPLQDPMLAREELLETLLIPFFEALAQNGVIGVATGGLAGCPCLMPREIVGLHQDAQKLCDEKSGVGIVDLNPCFIGKRGEIAEEPEMGAEDILQGGGDEEKLLLEPHAFAEFCMIVWVENVGERGVFSGLIEESCIIALKLKIAWRLLSGPESQWQHGVTARGPMAHNGKIVGECSYLFKLFEMIDLLAFGIADRRQSPSK
jgi:hypothetical protein